MLVQYLQRFRRGLSPDLGRISEDGRFYLPIMGKDDDNQPRFAPKQQGIFCHTATFIWLYQATHGGRFPPFDRVAGAQVFVNKLIAHGHPSRVTASSHPHAGDILLFAAANEGHADHSCVCKVGGKSGLIAGYNQQGWSSSSTPILDNDYSEFSVAEISWTARPRPFTSRRAGGKYIWAVREGTALGLMRDDAT